MGTRRNVDKTPELPKARVTAGQVTQIVKLYDLPMSCIRIAEELNLPVSTVRQTLAEMCPADAKLWREL